MRNCHYLVCNISWISLTISTFVLIGVKNTKLYSVNYNVARFARSLNLPTFLKRKRVLRGAKASGMKVKEGGQRKREGCVYVCVEGGEGGLLRARMCMREGDERG